MKKLLLIIPFVMIAFFAGTLFTSLHHGLSAQTKFTEQQVIDWVAQTPQFARVLADVDEYWGGWHAVAFDTKNAYGIWRVYFLFNEDGETIGSADVDPRQQRIYSWDVFLEAADAQVENAMPVLKAYLSNHPEIIALLNDPAQYDFYPSYNPWDQNWGVYISAGEYSLWVTVQFENGHSPTNLNNPRLTGIYFPDLPDYEEWLHDTQAQAVNIAFANSEVGRTLRGRTWTTQNERLENDIWRVTFLVDGAIVITATVDLETNAVLELVTP